MSLVEQEELQNEVHRKLGRNVLLFQEVETLLKLLIISSQVSFDVSESGQIELDKASAQQVESVRKQTMGQLIEPFLKKITTDSKAINVLGKSKEPGFSFGFHFTVQSEYFYVERKKQLALIVAKRNELIHHFQQKWNLNSIEGLSLAERYLDQQHIEVQPELQNLRLLNEIWKTRMKDIADFMISDEGKKEFELTYRKRVLVELLCEFNTTKARPDGWTLLSKVASFIQEKASEERILSKELYGCKTLKDFMLGTELFDFCEEPTTKGGLRLLYRIKSNAIAPFSPRI